VARKTVARVCASLVREIPLGTCGAAGLCCRCCRGRVLAVGAQLAGPRAIYILVLSRRTRHTGTTAGPRGVAAITRAVCNRHARRRRIRIRRTSAAQRSVLKGASSAGIALARRSEGQEHEHGCPHRVAHHHLTRARCRRPTSPSARRCALQNREYERSACGWLIASTRSLAASAWTQCYRNFRARGSMYRGGLWHAARPTRWRQLPRGRSRVSDTC